MTGIIHVGENRKKNQNSYRHARCSISDQLLMYAHKNIEVHLCECQCQRFWSTRAEYPKREKGIDGSSHVYRCPSIHKYIPPFMSGSLMDERGTTNAEPGEKSINGRKS